MPTPCDDLATKAELQELRDQLNAVLGDKEDGGRVTLFAKGASNSVLQAGVGLTLLGMAKNVAPKAVTDILLEGAATGVTWQKMASMNTGIKAKFGNGTTGSLAGVNAVANTAGQGAGAAVTSVQVGKTGAGSTLLLANLAQLAATLMLNKATVDIFDYRINQEMAGTQLALDAQNASMLRLYEKNQGDIDVVRTEIAQNNQIAAENRQSLQTVQADLSRQGREIGTFNLQLDNAQQQINQLQIENQENVLKINELTEELATTKADLTNQINTVTLQLEEANVIIEAQKADIEKTNERIALYEARVTEIEARMTEYEANAAQMELDFAELRAELDLIKELNPSLITERPTEAEEQYDKITYYENAEQTYDRLFREHNLASADVKKWSTIVRYELNSEIAERETRYALQAKKHGFNPAASYTATTQTGLLELTEKLSDPDSSTTPVPTTVTREDVIDNPQSFKERFAALLDRINPKAVTPEQLAELQTGIRTGVGTDLTAIFGSMIVPRLDNIADATSERKIAQGVQTGICNSLNGGSCPATPTNLNPTQGLQGMNNNLANWLGAGNLLQGQNITNIVKNTNDAVRHSKYGLEAVQGFADKAWKATQADKVLAVVNTSLLIHNAMMLSNNLFQTMGEATSMALNAIGIKDHEDNPIDVNNLVKSKITAMLNSVLGAENYAALTARIAKVNRIYQSSINLLDTTRSMFDSAQTIAEISTRYTGEIGNALRNAGVVAEDAYEEMVEKINPQSAKIMGFQKFVDGIEVVENAFDSVSQISSNVVEIQENVTQLKTEKQALKTELDTKIQTKKDERIEVKTDSQITADPDDADFDAAPPEL